jgi:hypothetical protein
MNSTKISDNLTDLKLLSINKAREILKIRHETVKNLIYEGKIEVIVIGKRVKIPMISLRKYIEENSKKLIEEEKEEFKLNRIDYIQNQINLIIKKHNREYR